MADMIGQQIGNYKLIRYLAQGGFAQVYLGEHVRLGTSAAVKVLKQQVGNEDFRRFIEEVRIFSKLRHPNIVRILDFGVEGDIPYISMDYAPNGTLHERHPAGTLVPLETVIIYVNQIAAALQYMHDEKLVHRNVKPNAMLVGRNNEILLGGFGIVQSRDAKEILAAGTYIAPEQIQGKPTFASDQYALAVVIYEWLAGKPLFEGTSMQVMMQHLTAVPPSLRDRIPLIPPAVELALTKALAKNPDQRFPSVIAFAQALAEGSGSYPTQNSNPYSYGSGSANVSPRQAPPSQQPYGSTPTYTQPPYTPYPQPSQQPYGSTPTYTSPYTPYPQQLQSQSEVAHSSLPPPQPRARRFVSFSWRGMLVGLIGLITIATVEVIANGGVAQLLQSPIVLIGLVGLLAIAAVGFIVKARFK